MEAKIVNGVVSLLGAYSIEGQTVLEVSGGDYEAYKALPTAVEYEGKICIKTGYNSDTGKTCYKSGVAHASAL